MSGVEIKQERGWKRYPAYKDSGVEWLGEIPEGWEVKRLKFLITEPLKYGANESAELEDKDSPRFIRITDISENGLLKEETFRSLPKDIAKPFILRTGDILFARSGATIGKSFVYHEQWGIACHAGYLIRARLKLTQAVPEFVSYFANSSFYWNWISSIFIQATIQNVSAEKYANLWIGIPQLQEQQAIAQFLDRETVKIDTLIAKKERLIELFKEKRTALISHAVTKGLNPDAPMKDSGIEWLGKIPEGWEVKPLKWLVSKVGSGKTPKGGAEVYSDSGIVFLRSQNVHFDGLKLDDVVYINEKIDSEMSSTRVLPFDILLNITGASLGRCTLVPTQFPRANVNQHVCIIRPITNLLIPAFLNLLMSSNVIQRQIFSVEDGVSREGLTFFQVRNLLVGLPKNIVEQQAIAQFLDRETAKIDTLVTKTRISIDKLKEYRTALISAAVTGKIDIRENLTPSPN